MKDIDSQHREYPLILNISHVHPCREKSCDVEIQHRLVENVVELGFHNGFLCWKKKGDTRQYCMKEKCITYLTIDKQPD